MSSTSVTPYNRVVTVETRVHLDTCIECGVLFGYGTEYKRQRQNDHGIFYCPNGHGQHYSGDNAEEALRKEKERLETQLRHQRDYTERERQRRLAAERQRSAAKGQLTKTKNRIANGVCPCCNRSFVNLGKHMAGQHPGYTDGGAK